MADIVKINLNGVDYNVVDSAATSAIAAEETRAKAAESANTQAIAAEVVARQSAITQVETALSGKANTATTLSGYGITDAYTSAQTQSAITEATSGLQETLTAGTGIDITNNVISCTVDTGLYVVVQVLPAQPAAGNENKIHLVPLASGDTGETDYYEEYLWKGDAWEYLGTRQVDVDLSDYWTSAQTQSAITQSVSGLASESYVQSAVTAAVSGITAEYSAATETLILNIPAPEAGE